MKDLGLNNLCECIECGTIRHKVHCTETPDGWICGDCGFKLAELEETAKAAVVAEIGQDRADRHEEAGEWAVMTYLLGPNPRIR